MRLHAVILDEAKKFIGMIPVRVVKAAGWVAEWPLSALSRSSDHKSVFVLAVPRSGSTLLYNLIAWNDGPERELVGYGENCASYHTARDARRLRARTMLYLREAKPPRYVVDKLVQSRYRIADPVLADPDCYFIFLDRASGDVIASLERKLKLNGAQARELLARRSEELAAMEAKAVNKLSVSYEQLLADPEAVLDRIGGFLGLVNGLTSQYEIPPNVENFSYGDDGELIRHGRVVARPERP